MSNKLYYAVRVGRKEGIYTTWEECRALVEGYSNAEFQGFPTEKQAIEYLAELNEKAAENKEFRFVGRNTVQIKGSYNSKAKVYGGAYAIIDGFGIIHSGKVSGTDKDKCKMENVAGEILAVKHAINTALDLGMKELTIYYLNDGLEKWATGEWHCLKEVTVKYHEYIQSVKDLIELTFVKAKEGTSINTTDLIKKLAKEAVKTQ